MNIQPFTDEPVPTRLKVLGATVVGAAITALVILGPVEDDSKVMTVEPVADHGLSPEAEQQGREEDAYDQGYAEGRASISCWEDEVVVWTEDDHDACVPLDNMWMDPETGTIHWYHEDERPT